MAAADGGATPTAACCMPGRDGHMTMPYWVARPLGGADAAAAAAAPVAAGAGEGAGRAAGPPGGAGLGEAATAAEEVVIIGCADAIGPVGEPMNNIGGATAGAGGPGFAGCC